MEEYQKKSCKWSLDKKENILNPHRKVEPEVKKIYGNVLEYIGNTPMIKLNNIPRKENIKCEILAKCEFFNPGGSTKDRIGLRMVQELQHKGKLKPGATLIEATSGNTGIGIALVGAVSEYNVIIPLPEKMSQEKSDTLKGLGAKIIRTPTEAPCDHVDSHIGVAIKLNKEIEDSVIPDQYVNEGNALAHYDGTGQEIWDQCDGNLDYCIIAAGTGGCLTGIARKLKEKNPNIQIIGVDPHGSILALPDSLNEEFNGISYKVEGTGYDFVPKNCDRHMADKWYKSNDKDSFYWARRLIKEEGLLVGGSSGSVIYAAIEIAKSLPEGKRIVCVFVDSVRNYMTKFLNDDWMIENGFYDQNDIDKDLNSFGGEEPIKNKKELFKCELELISDTSSVEEVLNKMNEKSTTTLPVSTNGKFIGLITKRSLTAHLLNFTLKKSDYIKKAVNKDVKRLDSSEPLKFLSKAFIRHESVFVLHEGKIFKIVSDDMLSLL